MDTGVLQEGPRTTSSGLTLYPKERTILERELMAFRPFGLDEEGRTIRDLSGMSVRATVLHLENILAKQRGDAAGREAVQELCRLLNERIKDRVYHVTPDFLRNPWNSYSYEFAAYLYEFCERLSGDPQFLFHGGMEKASPIMQVLARPFSLAQIYGMFPYFGNKFASGSIECRVVDVTPTSATLAMRFSERTLRQFGPYRRRCAHLVCQSAQGILAAVPARVHGLPPATLRSLSCIVDDEDWCRWGIRWREDKPARWGRRRTGTAPPGEREAPGDAQPIPLADRRDAPEIRPAAPASPSPAPSGPGWDLGAGSEDRPSAWLLWSLPVGAALSVGLWLVWPAISIGTVILMGLVPVLAAGLLANRLLRTERSRREALIQEQINFVESRHEELREAYLEQEQTRVELRRKVTQLTALHRAGLLFGSTLDREMLLQQVLETLTRELHYDRAMVSFYDPVRRVVQHARIIGVSPEVEAFARSCQIPVTDPESPEGRVVLQGVPLLIDDMGGVWPHLHPANQRLVKMSKTKALIIVPLKTKDRILGTLTVDRSDQRSLTQDDLELMTTVANQVAIALDNVSAYQQIEEWNAGLEMKVRERTAALEQADRLRAQFLSHVSHELKTPLTSIKGFLQNLLDGLTGPLNEKQQQYVRRMLDNADRLIRMIEDLLDRTRIEAGRVELTPVELDLAWCLEDAVEQLRPLAAAKGQRLELYCPDRPLAAWADRDRLIQVVVNLVQNAVKYTPNNGVITVCLEPASRASARIVVRDTGPGIPPDCLEKIFDPFFRVQQGRSGPKGLGLGLSIVKTLVELQGGRVAASNHPAGGAEVGFTLPLLPAVGPSDNGARRRPGRILIVDDDPDIRELLVDRLRSNGYHAVAAVDGREAFETLATQDITGVLLDIGIGQMDGLEVLRRIREQGLSVPVIMITASGSQELAVRAIGMGAQAYLLKPFDAAELEQVMHTWFCESP